MPADHEDVVFDSFDDLPLDEPPEAPDGDDEQVDPAPPPLVRRLLAQLKARRG